MSDRRLACARTGHETWLAGGAMGDVLEGLKKEGHITDSQYIAGLWLLEHMRRSHGNSGGLVPEIGERVQVSLVQHLYPPGGGDPDSFAMLSRVLAKLRKHERDLLSFLIIHKEQQRGSLADWGRVRSGFENGRFARAYTTGQISSALSTLEELRPGTP